MFKSTPLSISNFVLLAPSNGDKVSASSVPAMMRRRCSTLSKMALEASNQAIAKKTFDYAVFASQHGELACSLSLLNNIARQERLSPMKFVQSVHNTSAGMLAIILQSQQNMTAIAAGDNSFAMAFLDAFTWLDQHPEDTVLVSMFDDLLPAEYQQLNIRHNHQYALAFLLHKPKLAESGLTMALQAVKSENEGELTTRPLGLDFSDWFLNQSTATLSQRSPHYQLTWQRPA